MTHFSEKSEHLLRESLHAAVQTVRRYLATALPVLSQRLSTLLDALAPSAATTRQDRDASAPLHTAVATAHHAESVAEIKRRLARTAAFETVELLFVTDHEQKLLGVVPLSKLFDASANTPIAELMNATIDAVTLDDPAHKIADTALTHRLAAVPVVGEQGQLLGAVPTHALFARLQERHRGVSKNSAQALLAFEGEPLRRVLQRLPWLVVGTIGCILATGLMARFENALRADVAVAFFIPGIVYLADAIGTQAEAIAVRGLSFSQSPLGQLLKGEFTTGLYLGVILALLVFPFIWIAYSATLAFSVAIALICASSVATSIGCLLPVVLTRLGKDPAYGSGPVATIVQDLLSLLIYLSVIEMLVF